MFSPFAKICNKDTFARKYISVRKCGQDYASPPLHAEKSANEAESEVIVMELGALPLETARCFQRETSYVGRNDTGRRKPPVTDRDPLSSTWRICLDRSREKEEREPRIICRVNAVAAM